MALELIYNKPGKGFNPDEALAKSSGDNDRIQKSMSMTKTKFVDLLDVVIINSFSRIVIYVITSILTFSCQQRIESDFERTEIVVNDQRFEVLTMWEIFDDYIEMKPDYKKNIYQRIIDEFNYDTEYPFLFDAIKGKIEPNNDFKQTVELMKSIDFVRIVDSTYQIVTKELPGPDTKILFIPTNPAYREIYKDFGVGFHAFTPGAGKIIVSFDPTFDNSQQFIPYALAHEYHHSVWTYRNFETADLSPLEYLVMEGMAESFALGLFSDVNHPFINMLDEKDEARIWDLIKPEMNKRDSDMNDMLYYGTKNIPFGSVYAIGFNIIESFEKSNPQITEQELIDISPEIILLQSKYDE